MAENNPHCRIFRSRGQPPDCRRIGAGRNWYLAARRINKQIDSAPRSPPYTAAKLVRQNPGCPLPYAHAPVRPLVRD